MHESPLKLGNREMNNGTVWLNLKEAGNGQPLTLRGSKYAHGVQELNKAVDRAGGLLR